MKETRHIRSLTRTPSVAQSLYGLKLASTTEIIDLLVVLPRQIPWKAGGPRGTEDDDTDTDPDVTDTTNPDL